MSGDVSQPTEDTGRTDSQLGTWVTVAASLLAFGLIALMLFWFTGGDQVEPPDVDLTDVSQEVATAVAGAREFVRANPRSAQAWGQLAMSLRAHDFGPEADVCFRRAAELDPLSPRWPYLLGVSQTFTDVEGAMNCYRRAIAIQPDFKYSRLRLAELLLGEARVDEAEQQLLAVIRQDPEDPRAQLGLARVAWLRDEVEESLRWAQQSADRAGGQRATHELLSRIFHRLGDRDAAQRELDLLKELPPGKTSWDDPLVAQVLEMRRDPSWNIQKSQQLFNQGQKQAAISLAASVVNRHPEEPFHHAVLGRMLIFADQFARAAEVLDQAIQQHPKTAELHQLRGVVHYHSQQYQPAAGCFREAIQCKPDHVEAHENLGHCLMQLQDNEGAKAAFRSAIQFDPGRAGAHANLGKLLLEGGQRGEAIKHLELAVELSPTDPLAQALLQDARQSPEDTSPTR